MVLKLSKKIDIEYWLKSLEVLPIYWNIDGTTGYKKGVGPPWGPPWTPIGPPWVGAVGDARRGSIFRIDSC